MSKPTQEQRREVFDSLVGNGLDFFVRSAPELHVDQKFAVAHFATGLELVLKARLFHEHWTLIGIEPHSLAWSSVRAGTAQTLAASELCKAIINTTSTSLHHEQAPFTAIFRHRNRVLHWAPADDLSSTVAEQCVAWHHLRQLMTTEWSDAFSAFRQRIDAVEQLFQTHRSYLEVKFQKLEPTLRGHAKAGLLILCSSCEFYSGVVEDTGGRVAHFTCQVYDYAAAALRTSSGSFSEHTRSKIVRALVPLEEEAGFCGECFDAVPTVVTDSADCVCVECGARFGINTFSHCEWCNQLWFGWDSEHSYYGGCERCDGRGLSND